MIHSPYYSQLSCFFFVYLLSKDEFFDAESNPNVSHLIHLEQIFIEGYFWCECDGVEVIFGCEKGRTIIKCAAALEKL